CRWAPGRSRSGSWRSSVSSEARAALPCGAALLCGAVLLAGCASPAAVEPPSTPAAEAPAPSTENGVADDDAEDDGLVSSGIFLSVLPITGGGPAKAWVASSQGDDEFAKGLRVRVEVLKGYRSLGELTRRTNAPVVNGVYRLADLSRLQSK